MGYYENPPIIQPAQDNIGSSIARAGESIAQGLIARGERSRFKSILHLIIDLRVYPTI